MKIGTTKRAISQSLDLFIIIAAVLAVGGLVTAAVYGLGHTATSQPALLIQNPTLSAGGATLSFSLKNAGTSTYANGDTVSVAVNGVTETATGAVTGSFAPGTVQAFTVAINSPATITQGTQYSVVVTLDGVTASTIVAADP